eukprot:CAMPEP_0119541640 /NCGR_PEP_ID=MMETSP1344-20130328/53083_1 /TAXON_ID=236787 /ORGANISM="Florenciella parvula, Strain CCMP2471" /LENGTH=158 /DNA_ID=CAMNT_0007585663 /DNA_START=272 /DNA_END=745 /DNA_ORIENTATION=-
MSSSSRNKPPAFQQYKYYLSHTLNLEIMANISKLYLPTSQIGTSFNAIEGECRLSVQVFSNGEPMHLPVNTYSPPRLSQVQSTINWEDFLLFPVKYKDLALNACLVFTVHSADGHIVGGASMGLFDGMGVLKTGMQKLRLYMDSPGSGTIDALGGGFG